MGEINKLFDLNIGLVLAGGGAKGAYEAGVFKALWDLDIISRVSVVSGTSIGTVNALMLAMNDDKIMDKSWSSLSYSRFITNEFNVRNLRISNLIKNAKNREGLFIESIRKNESGLLSQSGVKEFIEEYVDLKAVKNSKKTIYACAYNIDKESPEYFKLNDYSEEEIINISLASCAIPYIFKPIKINEYRYADGGINAPYYNKKNADNTPIKPLKSHGCDVIIVVHLSNNNINKSEFENTNIIEIHPSKSLETINGVGTLNLSSSNLSEHIDLGYKDALSILAPIIIKMLNGNSIDEIIS